MQRVRPGAWQRAVQGVTARGSIVLRGDHGSGRTSLLTELCSGAPWRAVTLTRLDVEGPSGALAALAAARPFDPGAGPAVLIEALGGAAVAVDDAQWLGEDPAHWLIPLVGAVPLVITLAAEEPGSSALEAALVAAGADLVELDPLDPDEEREVLAALGVPDDEREARASFAGGNLALLHHAPVGDPGATAPLVVDALTARLAAVGPAGAEVAAALHLAGGSAATAALDPDGVSALTARGWALSLADSVALRQGALGSAALGALDDDAVRSLHRALAGHGPAPVRARHLEAAGLASEAADLATAALDEATPLERPQLLELVHRVRGPAAGVGEALAAALLAVGRTSEAASVASTAGAPALLASSLRQRGQVGPALAALAEAPPGAGADETRQLVRWPGLDGLGIDRPPGDELAPLDRLVEGGVDPSELLAAGHRSARADRWDDAGRLATAVVLAAVRAPGEETAGLVGRARDLLGPAPPGPWHHTLAVATHVLHHHAAGAAPALAEAIAALVDVDHALPGVAAAHLALALSDLGRASDALAVLDSAEGGVRAPHGWDRDVLSWARAEVELAAGRPRRARQVLARDPSGREGRPADLLAQLRSGTAGWVALELGEEPPPARQDIPDPLAAEAAGHRALHAGDPGAAADAYTAAAAGWPSRRAAVRARWAAADALRSVGQVDAAVVALRVLEAEAEAAGHLPLLARVRSSLRRAGVRTRPSRPRSDPTPTAAAQAAVPAAAAGPVADLSPRERQVLELVAAGLPSGEIAERLGVGRSTVETQVASAMRKLGARTRRQAAAMLVGSRT